MKRYLPLLLLALMLMGQEDCEETAPPEPEPKGLYCDGATEPGVLASIGSYVSGSYAAIVDGNVSSDRRATVRIEIDGAGYCTGTVIGPHTVLSAAHCEGSSYRLIFDYDDGPDTRSMPYAVWFDAPYSKKHERYLDWSEQDSRDHDVLLIFTDSVLPGPYASVYTTAMHGFCSELVPQGWGRHEDLSDGSCAWHNNCSLRESRNYVAAEGPTWISTRGMPGWICFGDSGGPLYADVSGQPAPIVAGITSSTSSQDCKLASRHIKVEPFLPWIATNAYNNKPWLASAD